MRVTRLLLLSDFLQARRPRSPDIDGPGAMMEWYLTQQWVGAADLTFGDLSPAPDLPAPGYSRCGSSTL
ncbi:hypothetical protein J6590_029899 [Homalodisca vitripennis]|nr:hypothetical protein J6590_029899 [Homalodisca vitripennis]